MTFMPALLSSAARIAPAAPTPTMTTSAFSVAMLSSRSLFLQRRRMRHSMASGKAGRALPSEAAMTTLVAPRPSGNAGVPFPAGHAGCIRSGTTNRQQQGDSHDLDVEASRRDRDRGGAL